MNLRKEAEVKDNSKYFIDQEGRLVRQVIINGIRRRYFVGNNIQGFIETDGGGEYMMVQAEKRYWRGVFVPFPDRLLLLEDFSLFLAKPDCAERGLVGEIRSIVAGSFKILAKRSVKLNRRMIFRLYPYFYEREWERHLLEYLTAGETLALLVSGPDIFRTLPITRNYIRHRYETGPGRHAVYNLVHCSDSKSDAIREARVLFSEAELVRRVGFAH